MSGLAARGSWVALALGAALGGTVGFGGCSSPAPCGEGTCDGCCTPLGRCVAGDLATQCGRGGLVCEECGAGNTCTENLCAALNPVDAGTGGGSGCTVGFKGVTGAALLGTPIAQQGARNVALGDLDGDGKVDAVVAFSGTGQGYVLHGNGDGTFSERLTLNTLTTPMGVAIARLDGDARPDVVFVNGTGPSVVLLASADGGYTSLANVATRPNAMGVSVADVDGDGHADLVTPVRDLSTGDVWVNLGVGDGTFGPAAGVGPGQAVLFTDTADLDGDGKVDFVSVRNGVDLMGVVLRTATGEFAQERTWATGHGPLALATGLLDGDTRPDVVVVNTTAATLTVRPNDGDGTFPASATRATTSKPACLAIGDVTGDAIADVVVGGDKLNVFPGLGGGNLGIPTVINTAAASVAIADVDGNGLNDVVVLSPARVTTWLRGCW